MIEKLRDLLGAVVPPGRLKEAMRRSYYKRRNDLALLCAMIDTIEAHGDELHVAFTDGTQLIGDANEESEAGFNVGSQSHEYKYGDTVALAALSALDVDRFAAFLAILRSIFAERVYEQEYRLRRGDVVVDLGANVGAFSVWAARRVGDEGRVIAVEPAPANIERLKANIALNAITNCTVVPKGVWSGTETRSLFLGPAAGSNTLLAENMPAVDVQVDTLDNILSDHALPRVDFIKMDIEGAELEALGGMHGTLAANSVHLAIEAFHIVDGKPTAETLLPALRELGYHARDRKGFVYANR